MALNRLPVSMNKGREFAFARTGRKILCAPQLATLTEYDRSGIFTYRDHLSVHPRRKPRPHPTKLILQILRAPNPMALRPTIQYSHMPPRNQRVHPPPSL